MNHAPSTGSAAPLDPRADRFPSHSSIVGLDRKTASVRYDELEGLRGVAALLVALYHIPFWNPTIHRVSLIANGGLMVDLFFVLSGFVISSAYRTRLTTTRALVDFQILRFGRLYPVHILFLFVFLLIELSKLVLSTRYGINSNNTQPFVQNSWTAFIEQLLLIHPIVPGGNALTFNAPAWSIGVEFYTYLLFGLLCFFVPKGFNLIAVVIFAICTFLLLSGDLGDSLWIVKCWAGFFLGCLVQQASMRFAGLKLNGLLALSCTLMIVFLCLPQAGHWFLIVLPLSAMIVFSISAGSDNAIRRWLRTPALNWLGRMSYSIYMAHSAVIWFVSQVIRFGFSPSVALAPTGHIDAQLPFLSAWIACGFVVLLTLLVGYLVNRFVEEPFRRASRHWVAERS